MLGETLGMLLNLAYLISKAQVYREMRVDPWRLCLFSLGDFV